MYRTVCGHMVFSLFHKKSHEKESRNDGFQNARKEFKSLSALCVCYTHIHTCNTQSQIIMHPKAKLKSAQSTDKPNEFKRQNSSQASKMKLLYRVAAAAKSLQSCPTLCDPTDGSPPGSPVPGILQARTLEWVASSFSNAWKWKNKVKLLSHVRLLATPWTAAHQAPPSMGFSRQEYWSGVPSPSPLCRVTYVLIHLKKKSVLHQGALDSCGSWEKAESQIHIPANIQIGSLAEWTQHSFIPQFYWAPLIYQAQPQTLGIVTLTLWKREEKQKKREGANEVQTFQLLSIPTMIWMHQVWDECINLDQYQPESLVAGTT